jgi:hypothetical protein
MKPKISVSKTKAMAGKKAGKAPLVLQKKSTLFLKSKTK